MNSRLRIGILSFAHGHVNAYAKQILTFEDAELVACWDDDVQRGQAYAQAFGITFVPHLEDMLSRRDLDCLIIASETVKHGALAVAAVEAGHNVLLQKPMALTLEECDRIIRAVENRGVWFSLAFQMRCDPANIRMREIVRSGALGKIGTIRRRHCIGVLFDRAFCEGPTRWHLSAEANRGMFFDDAIHPMDWLFWTVGEQPVSVMAEIGNILTDVAPDDTGCALFRFRDGMLADIYNSSVTRAAENTTEIYGDKGVIIQNHGDGPSNAILPPCPVAVKMFLADEPWKGWQDLGIPIPAGHGERISAVARAFVDALRLGEPICSAREGRVSVEMCLAAYESAASGQRVAITQDPA
ncbi:MAG: oxidoreductase [Armatimonadota bacterium]|nr:MAG: oxidoreductase [Armatimonadota bacterium]